ncbi:hypothetical protein H0H81_004616 [Sphagnurus paluster]|uniref:Uncharacterized protein n=1 Tax=Sphagnurus paluster TaxID=117069 RepID=A0A9P7GSB4_9AGAR|nr:hypothetical protein H0H81_004616 [Sphagnurus paluster]
MFHSIGTHALGWLGIRGQPLSTAVTNCTVTAAATHLCAHRLCGVLGTCTTGVLILGTTYKTYNGVASVTQCGLLAKFAHRQHQNAAIYISHPRRSPSAHFTPAPSHTSCCEVLHKVIDLRTPPTSPQPATIIDLTRASESPLPDIACPTLHDVIDLTVLPEVALPSRDLYQVEISVLEDSGNEILEFFTDSEAGDEEEADTALIVDEKDSVE